MSCDALTQGKPCKNPAMYPESNPTFCWVHQGSQEPIKKVVTPKQLVPQKPIVVPNIKILLPIAKPVLEPKKPPKHKVPQLQIKKSSSPLPSPLAAPQIPVLPAKQKQTAITHNIPITEALIHEVLQRKQEIYSVISDLYRIGLKTYKGNRDAAVQYIKQNFTYDLYKLNLAKLNDGKAILIEYLSKFPQNNPEFIYFNDQITQFNKVINVLRALYGDGDPNTFENQLRSYEEHIAQLINQVESIPIFRGKIPKMSIGVKKVAIALQQK